MAVLSFTLSPEAVGKLHDVLIALGKFKDEVSIEASRDQLVFTALNSTNSAYASFSLAAGKFFINYSYNPPRIPGQLPKEKFSCKIYNKALLSVFKGRAVDPLRERDTGIEKCDVYVEDGDGEVKSRFVAKMRCRHGVLKTYRLTFESVASMHAVFKADLAKNHWSISSRTLREFIEHFGPKTEQLDIYSEGGRATFTSYTEKILSGNEVLKQPLHTSIAIDTSDFCEFSVEEKLHIVISVKDFKAIITHAGIINTTISARYSHPSKPMQLKYSDDGVTSEYILMTIGDFRGTSTTPAPIEARNASTKGLPRQALESSLNRHGSASATNNMPPPPRSAAPSMSREFARPRPSRPSPPPPQPSLDSNALFFPEDDDDRRWDPADYGDEDEEMLGWDASADNEASATSLSHGLQDHRPQNQIVNDRTKSRQIESTQRLEPTQRISQIRGIFDD